MPLGETGQHILRGHRLLTHARRCGLYSDNHTAVVIHQIVVVVTEPRRHAAFGRVGGIGIGGRYLILLVHRFFHRVLLFHFPQILAQGLMNLGCLRQLLARNAAFLAGIGFHETAIHRQVVSLHQAHFDTLPHDLLKQLEFMWFSIAR